MSIEGWTHAPAARRAVIPPRRGVKGGRGPGAEGGAGVAGGPHAWPRVREMRRAGRGLVAAGAGRGPVEWLVQGFSWGR